MSLHVACTIVIVIIIKEKKSGVINSFNLLIQYYVVVVVRSCYCSLLLYERILAHEHAGSLTSVICGFEVGVYVCTILTRALK